MWLTRSARQSWPVLCLAGSLVGVFAAAGLAPATTVVPAEVKVPASSRCLRVGQSMNLRLGAVGSRQGPFFRAVITRGNSLALGRNFIRGRAHVTQVKTLRPGFAAVEIQRRYFTAGIRIDAAGQPVGGGGRGFYSPWRTIYRVHFVVTPGPCPR